MKNTSKTTRIITQAAVIAALNTVLTYAQYLLWPESTSMAIQVRISEAMLVLAFFTPAAVPGMTIGCLSVHQKAEDTGRRLQGLSL